MDICPITLTAARESRLPLFPDDHTYLEVLRRLGAIVRGCLALFAIVAEHLHLLALLSRAAAGRLAQRIILTLRPVVATPLAVRNDIRMVESRPYLRWLLRYLLEQPRKHGMPGHPALWVGSCLPDLVGARRLSGLSLRIRQALPEYNDASALQLVGLPGASIPAADRNTLLEAGCHRLKLAAAAALGVDPALKGNRPAALMARRALAQLATRVGIRRREIATILDQPLRSIWRLGQPEVDQSVLTTVARRISLENLVHSVQAGSRGPHPPLHEESPRRR